MASNRTAPRIDPVAAKVRALGGTELLLHLTDDDKPVAIALPNTRKKWSALTEVLESYNWARLEVRDRKGAVLGVVDNDSAASTLEELTSPGMRVATQVEATLELLLRAQDMALKRAVETTSRQTQGYERLCASLTEVVAALAKQNQALLALAEDSIASKAEALMQLAVSAQAPEEASAAQEILTAMAPAIAQKLLTPAPAPAAPAAKAAAK